MKTNFLLKLFLLTFTCVSLNSCTVDEDTSKPTTQTSNSQAAKDGDEDGEPVSTSPRK